MKKNLLLPLVALSIISCSSDELQQQETPLRQKGTQEIVFDEIVHNKKVQSRAADIVIDGLFPTDVNMGVFYFTDDKKGLWFNNQKYEIVTNSNNTQKFTHIPTSDEGAIYYPSSPNIGVNAVAYIPYLTENNDIINIKAPGLDSELYGKEYDNVNIDLTFGDQLTKEQYRNHDLMYAVLNNMKADDASHHLDFIHVNYRMQLTLDLSEVGVRNLQYFNGATLSLIAKVAKTENFSATYDNSTPSKHIVSISTPPTTGFTDLGKILEIDHTPTSVNEKFVTTFCIPPHLLKADTPLFRLTFSTGATIDIAINPTADKLLASNKWTKYTLKLYRNEIILGAKMSPWSATMTLTGDSDDPATDVFMQ